MFSQCFKPGVAGIGPGKCPRRGAPVDATGHGLWSEDDGYDGDGEGAEDGEEMQVEEVRFLLMGRKKSQTAKQPPFGWCKNFVNSGDNYNSNLNWCDMFQGFLGMKKIPYIYPHDIEGVFFLGFPIGG